MVTFVATPLFIAEAKLEAADSIVDVSVVTIVIVKMIQLL